MLEENGVLKIHGEGISHDLLMKKLKSGRVRKLVITSRNFLTKSPLIGRDITERLAEKLRQVPEIEISPAKGDKFIPGLLSVSELLSVLRSSDDLSSLKIKGILNEEQIQDIRLVIACCKNLRVLDLSGGVIVQPESCTKLRDTLSVGCCGKLEKVMLPKFPQSYNMVSFFETVNRTNKNLELVADVSNRQTYGVIGGALLLAAGATYGISRDTANMKAYVKTFALCLTILGARSYLPEPVKGILNNYCIFAQSVIDNMERSVRCAGMSLPGINL